MEFQVTASLLDACVLAAVAEEDTYGYALTQRLRAVVDVSESTLYPVLRRLQKQGLLSTYDQPHNGRNRRYYVVSPLGRQEHRANQEAWESFKSRIDRLIDGAASAAATDGVEGVPA
ncbi:MAG: PadR family transcriptional regulator [Coriobacteriales bacterium]|nr:PadR family transcriptional regulator [Coriobacteriales bacterium]